MFKKIRLIFMCCMVSTASCATGSVIPANIDPNLMPKLTGVNAAGGEVDYTNIPSSGAVSGTNYMFVNHQDIDYLASKKMNFIRLLFSWELMQPTLNGPLDTGTYHSNMKDAVDYATSKNMFVLIEPHGGSDANFARYRGNAVGTSAVPSASFGDFWKKMADVYKGNPRVLYGLSNEPTNIGTMQWYGAAQNAIDGIRSSGSTQTIFVPGNGYTSPISWNDTYYDTSSSKVSNAVGWLTLKDPRNNLVASIHVYFDPDGGGFNENIVSTTILQERLAPVVSWARNNKIKVHLSELGLSNNNPIAKAALDNTLTYIAANNDVMMGWSWWATGNTSWWGSYRFTLCPKNNYTSDDPKMVWLAPYLVSPTTNLPILTPSPSPAPSTVVIPNPTQMTDANVAPSPLDAGTTTKTPVDAGPVSNPIVDAGPISIPVDAGGTTTSPKLYAFYARTQIYNQGDSWACAFIYVKNTTSSSKKWSSVNINMGSASLRDYWSLKTNQTWGSKVSVKFTPKDVWSVGANSEVNIGGFCMDLVRGQQIPSASAVQ